MWKSLLSISKTGHHELAGGKLEASSGLNHKRVLLQQLEYLHSMACVFSEVNVTAAPFLRPEFQSKSKCAKEWWASRSCSERHLGCGQDVHLKTRTAGVIMKNVILINFLSFPPNPWVQYAGMSFWSFLKVLYLTVYLHLCLLLWHLLPPGSRQTWEVKTDSYLLEIGTSIRQIHIEEGIRNLPSAIL